MQIKINCAGQAPTILEELYKTREATRNTVL